MKRFLFLMFIICTGAKAQQYKPIDTSDYQKRKNMMALYETEHKNTLENIKGTFSGGTKKELLNVYNDVYETINQTIKKKNIIFDERLDRFTNRLKDSLQKHIPDLSNKPLKLFVSRDPSPNAYCLLEGTIIVNIGLFRFFDTEDQLVSVVCHELGHFLKQHSRNNIEAQAVYNNSSQAFNEYRAIKRQKENRQASAFSIVKDMLYANGKKRRLQELEADSLGYALYTKLPYNSMEYINALYFLKEFDSLPELHYTKGDYSQLFSTPSQPFREEWLFVEDFSKYNYDHYKEKISKDSISTHPELDERLLALKQIYPELKAVYHFTKNEDGTSETFKQLKELAYQEAPINLIIKEEYGQAIYLLMQRLLINPRDAYYNRCMSDAWDKVLSAKKSYTMNRYIEHATPKMKNESYKQFLSFMWNLSLNEINSIADFYKEKSMQ